MVPSLHTKSGMQLSETDKWLGAVLKRPVTIGTVVLVKDCENFLKRPSIWVAIDAGYLGA